MGSLKFYLKLYSLSLGFVVVAMAFPEQRKLEQLEEKLAEARQNEARHDRRQRRRSLPPTARCRS